LQQALEQDSAHLRVIVMWEHVTPNDKLIGIPPTSVLAHLHDPRAVQFWDDERALSRAMADDLPADTLASVAEMDSAAGVVPWDCIAVFRAGRHWNARFPVPDWAGRPVYASTDTMMARLRRFERMAPADTAGG
jgi:hypothetical protein